MAEWLGSGLQHHLQQFESARYLKQKLVRNNKLFLYIFAHLLKTMRNRKNILSVVLLLTSFCVFGQCEYTLDNYTHNDCFGDSVGSIDISLSNSSSVVSWTGPNSFASSSLNITDLYAGTYYLTITNVAQSCDLIDSINIEETVKLYADFSLRGRCSIDDSTDVSTTIWGGTKPYSTIWENVVGDTLGTTFDIDSLPPSLTPYILTITDINSCQDTVHLWLKETYEMNPFMSSVGTICKDDNSGEARVFIQEGTAPFLFNWGVEGDLFLEENDVLVIDSFSSISGLFPGIYSVEIIDDMGCVIEDSIEVKSNPNICLSIFKAFSPNDDNIHEFWEIENVHLYPEAVVSIYDRNGTQVFRRRNYTNSEENAFGGKDENNQPRPSGTYYYIIDLQNGDDVFKGTVTIVR